MRQINSEFGAGSSGDSAVGATLKKILLWVSLFVLFFPGTDLLSEDSLPPLVPEGERIENSKGLLENICMRNEVLSVSFSPDAKTIAFGTGGNTIHLWDVHGARKIKIMTGPSFVTSVAFSPDGKTIASASVDSTIRLWDVAGVKEIKRMNGPSFVTSIVFSPDGKTIASVSEDSIIRLWDVKRAKKINIMTGHTFSITSVVFSPDGKIIASASVDSTIRLWDVAGAKEVKRMYGPSYVTSIAFSPDGTTITSASGDNTILLWDVAEAKKIKIMNGHTETVWSVAFSPDGKTIASASADTTIRLWDAEGAKEIKRMNGHTRPVTSVAFSPDGKTIASESADGTIRLWDVLEAKEIKRITEHPSPVASVSFSTDRKTIVCASENGTIRLWDVTSGKEIKKLERYPIWAQSAKFNSNGKEIVSGTNDGRVIIQRKTDNKIIRQFIGGVNGNWLSINDQNRVLRYDDGTFLQYKDKYGNLSPVLPPKPKVKGRLEITTVPSSLQTFDGKTTKFELGLKNTGNGRVYWVNVRHNPGKNKNPFNFYPPKTRIRLEPGDSVNFPCEVSAISSYTNPLPKKSILSLEITTAFLEPIPVEIPLSINVPRLQLIQATVEDEDDSTLLVKLKNSGNQDILTPIKLNATISGDSLETQTRGTARAGETFYISYTLPVGWLSTKRTLNLTAKMLSHPVHVWKFKDHPIKLPRPPWHHYALLVVILSAIGPGLYYLRIYLHPLVTGLSRKPESINHFPLSQLPHAKDLLNRTGRLTSVLSAASIPRNLLDQAVAFLLEWNVEPRIQYLAKHLEAQCKTLSDSPLPLYQFRMSSRFMLNMEHCLLALPPVHMDAASILNYIKKTPSANYRVCVILSLDAAQQTELRKTTLNQANLLVAPDSTELTRLLLSSQPLETFAAIIAQQIKVTRISPYQTKGGVAKESVFFGREQLLAHILQREPSNYLMPGGRQLGKSSVLKAIDRHYKNHPSISCHYLVLSGNEITPHLARVLEFPLDTQLAELSRHLADGPTRIFLIDEADSFIAAETERNYATLHLFHGLSEEGKCFFIFTGFWGLYHAAALDYQSPLKNFGETVEIGPLERDACRLLATKPMSLLNFHYESPDDVEMLIDETGQRPNLIAIACNEILQHMGIADRIISRRHVENALHCDGIFSALSGWETLTSDEQSNRLDRIVVYATINWETFTFSRLVDFLASKNVSYEPEALRRSLARLVLAFVLERRGETYAYRVPIFKKMLLSQAPDKLLEGELR